MLIRALIGGPLLIVLGASLAGCSESGSGPTTIEATGVVTLDGAPVEGATVFFHPAAKSDGGNSEPNKRGAGKLGVGETDAAGRFSMTTNVKGAQYQTGVAAGDYRVTIEKLESKQRTSTLSPPKDLLPGRYKDRQTSQLTATVASDNDNEFEFPLQQKAAGK